MTEMKMYWMKWERDHDRVPFGFPWTYSVSDSLCDYGTGIIAAESEEEAWEKADWACGVRRRRTITEIESPDDVPVDLPEPDEWWPDPKIAWKPEHMNKEEAWDASYWSDEHERLPRIFGFVDGINSAGFAGIAVAEDGKVLARHLSSSRSWALHDIFNINKKAAYDAYYPEGGVQHHLA